MLMDGQTKRSTRKHEDRLSGFSTQDQDSDVMCISDTQWSGKPGKNVWARGPWVASGCHGIQPKATEPDGEVRLLWVSRMSMPALRTWTKEPCSYLTMLTSE